MIWILVVWLICAAISMYFLKPEDINDSMDSLVMSVVWGPILLMLIIIMKESR